MVEEAVSGKNDYVEVVDAVKRTVKWLRKLYKESRTMWRLLML